MEFTKRFSIAHPEKDMKDFPNHYYLILNNITIIAEEDKDDLPFIDYVLSYGDIGYVGNGKDENSEKNIK